MLVSGNDIWKPLKYSYYFRGSVYVYEIAKAITKTLERIVERNAAEVWDQTTTTVRRLSFRSPTIVQGTTYILGASYSPRIAVLVSSAIDCRYHCCSS